MSRPPKRTKKSPSKQKREADLRVQLLNEGKSGPIQEIQVPVEMVTSLRGILFDIDLELIRKSRILPQRPKDPKSFYDEVLSRWLAQHPVLDRAEVRISGRGLHVILRFTEPVAFENEADRERWAAIVQVVQAALPIDPDQPGITATTRKLRSVNSKNGAVVRLITRGQRVTQEEVLELFEQMRSAPFKTVIRILTGAECVAPCPVCGGAETRLSAGDYVGFCYGGCGKVPLERLYDLVLNPRKEKGKVRDAARKTNRKKK
jgi:hypothetical protein